MENSALLNNGTNSTVLTRLYFPSVGRYVCFSRCGRVVTAFPRAASEAGKRCAFVEVSSPRRHSRMLLRSAAKPSWHLGFSRARNASTKGLPFLPVEMHAKKRGVTFLSQPPSSCDFLFVSRECRADDALEFRWRGLYSFVKRA